MDIFIERESDEQIQCTEKIDYDDNHDDGRKLATMLVRTELFELAAMWKIIVSS